MQRDEARLGPEPDEGRDRDERLGAAAGGGERRRVADRAVVREREQGDPDPDPAQMRDREIRVHGRAHLPLAAREEDRGRGEQRHQLPESEEADHVASREHPDQRQQERRGQRADRPLPCAAPGQIVARE